MKSSAFILIFFIFSGCNNLYDEFLDMESRDMIYKGISINPHMLNYNPTDEVIFSSVIDASKVFNNYTHKYYMYFAPHDVPGGICLAMSNSLEGPWQEYDNNPIIKNKWLDYYSVSHVSSPHALWIKEQNRLYLYFHGENNTTRYAISANGIDFEYGGIAFQTLSDTTWVSSTSSKGYYGKDYLHDQNTHKGKKSIIYNFKDIPIGEYALSMIWVSNPNRSTNVDVNIRIGDENRTVYVNQTLDGGYWNVISKLSLNKSENITVEIRNDNSNGYVIADAVKLTNSYGSDIIIDNDNVKNVIFNNSSSGPDLASYARVYYSPVLNKGKYLMTFMGHYNAAYRIFFAYSNDGKSFTLDKSIIVSSDVNNSLNISGAFFINKGGKSFLYYHDSIGKIYERSLNSTLEKIGKSKVFFEMNNSRVAAPFFIEENNKTFMFFDHGIAGKTSIDFAIANYKY